MHLASQVHRRIFSFTLVPEDRPCPREGDSDRWHAQAITVFLLLGVAVRLLRYALKFPLWGDEALLGMNFLDRDFADMLRPLDNHQVAPLLFLWLELAAVKMCGFNEWALRIFPLLCSLASLFLFHRLARSLLQGTGLVLAVAIFSVSYSGIRYAAEMKPYAVDLFVATALLAMTVRWWRRPSDARWLWALAAFVPLALGLSYPAVFIAGGISIVAACVLMTLPAHERLRSSPTHAWLAWAGFNLILVVTFATLYWLTIRVQSKAELGLMVKEWGEAFPPQGSLVAWLKWLFDVHAGPLLAQPVGGRKWGSLGTTLLCAVAMVVLLRRGRYRIALLCAMPFALNFLAAVLHRYPYGGHMRLAMHLAPLVCILAGIGGAALLGPFSKPVSLDFSRAKRWLTLMAGKLPKSTHLAPQDVRHLAEQDEYVVALRKNMTVPGPILTVLTALFVLGALTAIRDCWLPGKEQQEIRRRDFARWFWGSLERSHEVVYLANDWGKTFPPPGKVWQACNSPQFICNVKIYSPRLGRCEPPCVERVSRDRPLACVQYWTHMTPYDQQAFNEWLAKMQEKYEYIGRQDYPILSDNDHDRVPEPPDRVEVYKFVPKQSREIVLGIVRVP